VFDSPVNLLAYLGNIYIYTVNHRDSVIVMTMPTRASRDRDNFHTRVFKAISLSETRLNQHIYLGCLVPMVVRKQRWVFVFVVGLRFRSTKTKMGLRFRSGSSFS
jgi:hypothetical protein